MEVCASRALSTAAPAPALCGRISPTAVGVRLRPSFSSDRTVLSLRDKSGAASHRWSPLRAASSEDTPGETNKFDRETSSGRTLLEDVPPAGNKAFINSFQGEGTGDDSSSDEQTQLFGEFLDKFNLKLNTEDPYSLLLYGSGALVSVWLLSAVVGAIDSIPLFPQLMEVVGLSYSLWFTTRYLIFKKNRDELSAKIEELKQQVIGTDED